VTIQIPDELDTIAAAQRKSVEQVAVENLRQLFERSSSPEVVIRSLRRLPHPSAEAVDDLEAAIAAGRGCVCGMKALSTSGVPADLLA
jgi:hypothetical protein